MNDVTDAIPAATILLLRDEPAFEVLMIERHADTPFAGGALVFPGGRIDRGDFDAAWMDHCDGIENTPEQERAPRVAALREAFEEAGILFARRGDTMVSNAEAAALNEWRIRIEGDDSLFLELIKGEGLRLALDALHLFARWEPPPSRAVIKRRYHTWFFAAKTPPGQEAREDGNEATEALWIEPEEALAACAEGKRKMIFPTTRNVELLGVSANSGAVLDFADQRKIDVVMPAIADRGGKKFLTIPEGLGYPVTEEPLETAFKF